MCVLCELIELQCSSVLSAQYYSVCASQFPCFILDTIDTGRSTCLPAWKVGAVYCQVTVNLNEAFGYDIKKVKILQICFEFYFWIASNWNLTPLFQCVNSVRVDWA